MKRKASPPNSNGQSCGQCQWCRRIEAPGAAEPVGGECLRFPPAVISLPDPETDELDAVSLFPMVDLVADYCGEFKARQ